MTMKSLEQGDYLYKNGDTSTELYIIQSGELWIQTESEGGTFVIEKLFRGSVINHNSFLLNDEMDTDAYCKTNIEMYCIHIDKVNQLRDKYYELDTAVDDAERKLVKGKKREPAIDYIFSDEYSNFVNTKKGQLKYRYRVVNLRS